MKKLDGKVAFMTGGSQGIGEATALLFGREGARVAFTYARDDEGAEATREAADGEVRAFRVSVLDVAATEAMIAEVERAWGGIDVLVNNAGISQNMPLALMEEEDWDRVMDINVKGTWNAICAIAPSMRERKTGWIINISSVLGTMALANYAVYCASKAAVNMLTRSLSIEFGRDGVHVNCLAPGNTATPMNENLRTEPQYKGFIDMMAARTPSGRTYSKPEEMAQAALYLACDDSKPVHGAILVLDEGFSLGV